jgi:Cytochrome P450
MPEIIEIELPDRVVKQAFTHALYDLAANPQYIQPLREEVEENLTEKGWTKAAMDKMWKVDSFLKESMRLHGFQLCACHCYIVRHLH